MNTIFLSIGIFLLLMPTVSAANKIYLTELTDTGDNLIADTYVSEGFISNMHGNYRYTLLSVDGKVLDTFNFGTVRKFRYHTHEIVGSAEDVQTQQFEIDIASDLITSAYFPNGDLIRLSNPDGSTLAEIDVSRFADKCGDNICQSDETYLTCFLDCPFGSGDNCDTIADSICDTECSKGRDVDCKVEIAKDHDQFKLGLFLTGIGTFGIGVMLLMMLVRVRKY